MNNLYNPMEVKILKDDQQDSVISVQPVSRNFYDRLLMKDPMTIYIITDTGEIYKGDIPWGGINPHKPHSRYLSLKKTPAGTEYVIVEYRNGGMIEICSYRDPQDAIDFLDRSIHPFDLSSAKRDIIKILQTLRELTADLRGSSYSKGFRRTGELYLAIKNIMRIYTKLIHEEHLIDELDQIFEKWPNAAEHICADKRAYKKWTSHRSYHAYELIWIYLRDIGFIRQEYWGNADAEYRLIEDTSDAIITILTETLRNR